MIVNDLKRALDDGMTPGDAAGYVIGKANIKQLREYVMPIVEQEARMLARRVAQVAEAKFTGAITVPEMARVLTKGSFCLSDGRWVTWGQATAEDHRDRAARQRVLAGTILDDAERHDRAADAIEAAGVRCLDDLEQARVNAKPMTPSPAPGKKRRAPEAVAVPA